MNFPNAGSALLAAAVVLWVPSPGFAQVTSPECAACVFGPQLYTRSTGTPRTASATFAGDPAADYVIDIDDMASQGADGSVVLNGEVLLAARTASDDGPRHVHQPITLRGQNSLDVRLTGKPGSVLNVQIIGGTKTVGAAGGTLRVPGGGVEVTIPPAALATDAEITIAPDDGATPPDHLEGTKPLGRAWSLEPHGLRFAFPVTLSVDYSSVLGQVSSSDDIGVVHWSPGSVVDIATAIDDRANHRLSFTVDHFSFFGFLTILGSTGYGLHQMTWSIPVVNVNSMVEFDTWAAETSGVSFTIGSPANIVVHRVDITELEPCPAGYWELADVLARTCFPGEIVPLLGRGPKSSLGAGDQVHIWLYTTGGNFPPVREPNGTVLRHAIGHALGIAHPWRMPASGVPVMAPIQQFGCDVLFVCLPLVEWSLFDRIGLHQQDVDALQAKYGPVLTPPVLISPTSGATIPQNNPSIGCPFDPVFGFGAQIVFDWADAGPSRFITGYQIESRHQGAPIPIVNRTVANSTFTYLACNSFVADGNLTDWFWRVRVLSVRGPGEWSESRPFSFAPCRFADGRACGVAPRPDLTVTMTDDADPVTAGTAMTYTVTVQNIGEGPANAVLLTDVLPAGSIPISCTPTQGSCVLQATSVAATLGVLAAGATAQVAILVTAPAVAVVTALRSTATATTSSVEVQTSNNFATRTTTVVPVANVAQGGGPGGGASVTAIVVDPLSPDTLYAGTNGGMFRSTNGGGAWHPANAGINPATIGALILVQTQSSVLYAGTTAGVFRTINGANNWVLSNTGLTTLNVQALAVNPANSGIVYAGTRGGGVFKSVNAAGSWQPTGGLPSPNVGALAVDHDGNVYAGTEDAGLFKSTDAGATWLPVGPGLTDPVIQSITLDVLNPGTIYVTTLNGGVFKTIDAGGTWLARNAGLPRLDVRALAVDRAQPGTLYAATFVGMAKSVDGGANWVAANTGLTVLGCCIAGAFSVAVDPSATSTVYAGTNSEHGVFKSTNAAASWTPASIGLDAANAAALLIDSSAHARVFAATQTGAVYRSEDAGGHWLASNSGFRTIVATSIAQDPSNPSTMYVGTAGGTIRSVYKSVNGGTTWTDLGLASATAVQAVAIDPAAPSTVYAGTAGSGILKSSNGGATWSPINLGLSNLTVQALAVHPNVAGTVYAGTRGGVFGSTDGGAHWTALSAGLGNLDVLALAVDWSVNATIYAATNGGGIFKAINGGLAWTAINTGIVGSLATQSLAIDPLDPQVLYAGRTGANKVVKTINGGASWANSGVGLPVLSMSVRSVVIDRTTPDVLFLATSGAGVFKSSDGGATWQATGP